MLESLFGKVASLQGCNFIKKRLQHRCFPVQFVKKTSKATASVKLVKYFPCCTLLSVISTTYLQEEQEQREQ